jgi:hypothetical protein
MKKIFDKMVCKDCDLFQPDTEDKGKGYCWKSIFVNTEDKTVVSIDDGCPSFRPKIDLFVKTAK